MDYRITWSAEAIEDLESITEYIAKDSEFYAKAVATKLLAIPKSIVQQPLIGRIVPELSDKNIRERFVYSYRVVYQIKKTSIIVLAIIHGNRLIENVDRF